MAKIRTTNVIKSYKTGELYTGAELKAYLKGFYGWSDKKYKSERQKALNRLHNYEELTGQKAPIDVDRYLFFKARKKYPQLINELEKVSSASVKSFKATAAKNRAKEEREAQRRAKAEAAGEEYEPTATRTPTETAYINALKARWKGVIDKFPTSPPAELFKAWDKFKISTQELAQKLEEYGRSLNERHANSYRNRNQQTGAIPAISYE